ncbi:hypothetical protein [Leptospira mtsangambouensis]|uniref:hypothetical protein n=1 Tax=Leptospira mtsangambouensis TaxID=2484912 RepID=UPI001EEA25A3|nr:hypothetical protein [Leptospira mtsangambouensis]MCG6140637.1 hypothetical protein [Leptospira mtsangambouensis]
MEDYRVNQTYDFIHRESYDYASLIHVFEERARKAGWKRVKENPAVMIDLGLESSLGEYLLEPFRHTLKVRITDKNQTIYYGEVFTENFDRYYIDSIPYLVTAFLKNYPSRAFKLEKRLKSREVEYLTNYLSLYYNN